MSLEPPLAEQRPVERALWGTAVVDEYHWLRDREDPEVVALLTAENAHTEAMLEPTKALQQQLFDEIRSRVKETDLSVPVVKDGWSYYSRTVEGAPYGIHCRRFVGLDADQLVADRVVERLSQPSMFQGEMYRISASIGITISTDYYMPEAERMLSDADEALYASKNAGRGQARLFRAGAVADRLEKH